METDYDPGAVVGRHIADHPELFQGLRVRWNPYIPHNPTPKQRAFLSLTQREAFYGGAAGGGKSDALLMAALQYVDIPHYAAILFRKTMEDAFKPEGIGFRFMQWMNQLSSSVTMPYWESKRSRAVFPSGATLTIGGLRDESVKFSYDSTEFQFIGFDELRHFPPEDYTYLFTRLRRPRCPLHRAENLRGEYLNDCRSCREYSAVSQVPLRMRAASNPGGIGHAWIKRRYKIGPYNDPVTGEVRYIGHEARRPFIPAQIEDNPFLDQESYKESLLEMKEVDPITMQRMLKGDWSVSEDSRFRRDWCKYYKVKGEHFMLNRTPVHMRDDGFIFSVIDPAMTEKEGPGDTQVFRKQPSWTVIGTFFLSTRENPGHLLWIDNLRFRKELPELFRNLKDVYHKWSPQFIGMEFTTQSQGLYQICTRAGLPMRAFQPGTQDKVARSIDAATRMYNSKFWLPEPGHVSPEADEWLMVLEDEIFTWTGDSRLTDDQVDVASYASRFATKHTAGHPSEDSVVSLIDNMPTAQ